MLVPVQFHTKHNFLASIPNEKMDRPIEFFGKCENNVTRPIHQLNSQSSTVMTYDVEIL
jgi:hypothetical protein